MRYTLQACLLPVITSKCQSGSLCSPWGRESVILGLARAAWSHPSCSSLPPPLPIWTWVSIAASQATKLTALSPCGLGSAAQPPATPLWIWLSPASARPSSSQLQACKLWSRGKQPSELNTAALHRPQPPAWKEGGTYQSKTCGSGSCRGHTSHGCGSERGHSRWSHCASFHRQP